MIVAERESITYTPASSGPCASASYSVRGGCGGWGWDGGGADN